MSKPTREELIEKWRTGKLLNTPTTRRWSEQMRIDQGLVESCMVFLYFKEEDQGRSRIKLASCGSPSAAKKVVDLHNSLIDAYLAQEGELESLKVEIEEVEMDRGVMVAANGRANKIIEQLKAENQALKASTEAEYIERQAKHIQELVKENQELNAKLEGTFKFDEPKRGEILRYIADGATGDDGNEGGQP